jgi:hypothetical protein
MRSLPSRADPSWTAKAVTQGAASTIVKTPTLVIWGMKDTRFSPAI